MGDEDDDDDDDSSIVISYHVRKKITYTKIIHKETTCY